METVKDYRRYKEKVFEDFSRVQRFFPLLTLSVFPTIEPIRIIFIGFILPPKMISIASPEVINEYGFKIRGEYPFAFPKKSVEIFDMEFKINWDKVPREHRHIYDKRTGRLCTHHPSGEINSLPETDQTVAILISAWQLYYQVKICAEEGKVWTLRDLPHGDRAYAILRREGRIK
ncbi:MAG: hypothetical protein ACYC21_07920 [Eubacteriales bacterium]